MMRVLKRRANVLTIRTCSTTRRQRDRRASVLIAVLTCTLVAIALVSIALRATIRSRRECKLELQRAQLKRVLDAGVDRAWEKLGAGLSDYRGEEWVLADVFPQYEVAKVVIAVSRDQEEPATENEKPENVVTVIATLGTSAVDQHSSLQRSRTFRWHSLEAQEP